jgi:hypothetical protein
MNPELKQQLHTDLDTLWRIYVVGSPHGPDEPETVHGMDFLASVQDYILQVLFNSRGGTTNLETLKHLVQASLNCVCTREAIENLIPAEPIPVTPAASNILPLGDTQ